MPESLNCTSVSTSTPVTKIGRHVTQALCHSIRREKAFTHPSETVLKKINAVEGKLHVHGQGELANSHDTALQNGCWTSDLPAVSDHQQIEELKRMCTLRLARTPQSQEAVYWHRTCRLQGFTIHAEVASSGPVCTSVSAQHHQTC